jgi:hypothetical protein
MTAVRRSPVMRGIAIAVGTVSTVAGMLLGFWLFIVLAAGLPDGLWLVAYIGLPISLAIFGTIGLVIGYRTWFWLSDGRRS